MNPIPGSIRFACLGCGNCCTGEPGTVYVSPAETISIAAYLCLTPAELKQTFLFPFRDGYSIREDKHYNCLFYDGSCGIYPVRPAQCYSSPFWLKNLRSLEAWREVERECPGIGHGPLYSEEAVLSIMRSSPL